MYRLLLDNPMANKPNYITVWIHLLLLANHKNTSFIFNNKKQFLKAGQLITGRKKLSKLTGISESGIYKILKWYEMEQQIEQQKNNQFTLITILNWNKYQGNGTTKEQQKEQQKNNQVTTKRQPSNTYKNDKNVKNDKNKYIYADFVSMLPEEYQKLINQYGENNTIKFIDKLSIWKGAKGKTKEPGSDYLKILNWVVDAVLGTDKKKDIENRYIDGLKAEKNWEQVKEKRSDVIPEAINNGILKILKEK